MNTLTVAVNWLYVAAIVLLFVPETDAYLVANGSLSIPTTSLLAALLLPSYGRMLWGSMGGRAGERSSGSSVPLLLPLGTLLMLAFVSLIGGALPGANFDKFGYYLVLPLYDLFALVGIIFLARQFPSKRMWNSILAVTFILLVGTIIADFVAPGTFSDLDTRAAGLPRNANTAAFIVVMLLVTLLRSRGTSWWDIPLFVASGIGVVLTFSRGGFVLFGVVLAFYVGQNGFRLLGSRYRRKREARTAVVVLSCAVAVPLLAVLVMRAPQLASYTTPERMEQLSTVQRFISRDDSRGVILGRYLGLIQSAPLVGHGTGFSFAERHGPHNMYVMYWVENGIIGLLLYVSFIASCAHIMWKVRYSTGALFVLVVAIESLFSHNLMEQRSLVILLGIHLSRAVDVQRRA